MESAISVLDNILPDFTAAFIAAVLGFAGLVIAKENKTSEFRQQWIDALRQDLADYIAAVRVIAQDHKRFASLSGSAEQGVKFASELRDVYFASSSALARIRLRVNPDDPDAELKSLNRELLSKIKEAQDYLAAGDYQPALVVTNHLHLQAAPILKLEWERVKRGEKIYQLAKWGALVFLAGLLVFVVVGYAVRTSIAVS